MHSIEISNYNIYGVWFITITNTDKNFNTDSETNVLDNFYPAREFFIFTVRVSSTILLFISRRIIATKFNELYHSPKNYNILKWGDFSQNQQYQYYHLSVLSKPQKGVDVLFARFILFLPLGLWPGPKCAGRAVYQLTQTGL